MLLFVNASTVILLTIFGLSLIATTLCENITIKDDIQSKVKSESTSSTKNEKESLDAAESKTILLNLNKKEGLEKIKNQKEGLETAKSNSKTNHDSLDVAESKNIPIKTEKSESLEEAESKDKLEIVKRIKKINNDGSYTIGYEADDGSFKIESRDVLGNIKGTYGFLDENGEIKRISYSTNNSSNIFSKPQVHPEVSVVQRIPKITIITPRPTFASTVVSPSRTTSSNVIQTIAKKRPLVFSSTTTQRPKYKEIRTTTKIHTTDSTSATPRILLQRPSILTPIGTNKKLSEGQLSRPDTISEKPTKISFYQTIPNNKFIEDEKPVSEDLSDVRVNDLRRQLPRPHPQNIKEIQSHKSAEDEHYSYLYHQDTPDVYNTGMTEIVRPLFTTSGTPRKLIPILSGTTNAPVLIPRPTRYPNLYQRGFNNIEKSSNIADHPVNHVTSTQASSSPVPTILPVVQIPANKPEIRYAQTPEEVKYAQSVTQRSTINNNNINSHSVGNNQVTTSQRAEIQRYPQEPPKYLQRTEDPLVAIRHPFHRGAILVPLSQLQGNIIPIENVGEVHEARRNFVNRNQQEDQSATEVQIEKQKLLWINNHNKVPPLRPMPVHVDENGFIREVSRDVAKPYPLPIPVTPNVPVSVADTPIPKYVSNEVTNEIDNIEPPVSTRDFQKLLHQLVLRQRKLEKLNELMTAKKFYQNQVQPVLIRPVPVPIRGTSVPYVLRKVPAQEYREVHQYEPQPQESDLQQRQVVIIPRRMYYQREPLKPSLYQNRATDESIRRTSGQHNVENNLQDTNDEYLPPEVREMLLLKMLKLAINPALPIEEDVHLDDEQEFQTGTIESLQYKRAPMRNVEILGEESDEDHQSSKTNSQRIERSKRDREEDMEVME